MNRLLTSAVRSWVLNYLSSDPDRDDHGEEWYEEPRHDHQGQQPSYTTSKVSNHSDNQSAEFELLVSVEDLTLQGPSSGDPVSYYPTAIDQSIIFLSVNNNWQQPCFTKSIWLISILSELLKTNTNWKQTSLTTSQVFSQLINHIFSIDL